MKTPEEWAEQWIELARVDLTDPDAEMIECDPRKVEDVLRRAMAAAEAKGRREMGEEAAKIVLSNELCPDCQGADCGDYIAGRIRALAAREGKKL